MKARVYCTYKSHPIELRIVCLACLETHFCFPCSSMLTFKQNSTKRCCACALYLSYSSLHIANSNKSTNIQQAVAGCRASLGVRSAWQQLPSQGPMRLQGSPGYTTNPTRDRYPGLFGNVAFRMLVWYVLGNVPIVLSCDGSVCGYGYRTWKNSFGGSRREYNKNRRNSSFLVTRDVYHSTHNEERAPRPESYNACEHEWSPPTNSCPMNYQQ